MKYLGFEPKKSLIICLRNAGNIYVILDGVNWSPCVVIDKSVHDSLFHYKIKKFPHYELFQKDC